jgi:hypothetical protein
MPEGNLLATLRRLDEGKVQFIVVGGVAAVLNGAPIQTLDVGLVYSREPGNIDRISAVLESLDAVFRIQPERRLRARSHLAGGGHLNLMTCLGPLDLLGTIGQDAGFAELLPQSDEMDIGHGIRVRVLKYSAARGRRPRARSRAPQERAKRPSFSPRRTHSRRLLR